VATGGAGPVHAWGVARALGIRTLVFPPSAGVASAFGMLTAAPGFEFARSLPAPLEETSWEEVRRAVAELVQAGSAQLREAGVAGGDVRVDLAADVRHRGQGEAVTVALGGALDHDPVRQVEAAFQAAYTRLYGHRPPGVGAEVTTWRVRVMGPEPELDVAARGGPGGGDARKGRRPVWFAEADRFVETDVVDRYRLRPGAELRGPAVVEERESTTVVGPGGRARVDELGNLEVQVG
jgi:N-methylhydantoinase A/oxoprolinase/acetone carboxylase beta subunit